MKIISDEAKDNNSKVTGITMESLHNLELTNPRIDDLVVTHSLLERKDEFMKRSDAFLVLPGGVGSLDELAEILASNQLGIINKPVGLLNTDGYYDHLIAWFEKAVNEGFITQANLDELIITDNCEEMVDRILEEKSESSKDWKGRLGLQSLSLEIRIPSSNNIHIGNAKKLEIRYRAVRNIPLIKNRIMKYGQTFLKFLL